MYDFSGGELWQSNPKSKVEYLKPLYVCKFDVVYIVDELIFNYEDNPYGNWRMNDLRYLRNVGSR